jgi:hypothetical protein
MRLALVVMLFGACVSPVLAKSVTVEQLQQALSTMHDLPDAQVAQKLSVLELTERLSDRSHAHLEGRLPGTASRQALALLSDKSAFLDLPESELVARTVPDHAAQVALLGRTRDYVVKTIAKLPDFIATRETTKFVSSSINAHVNSLKGVIFGPFRHIDSSQVVVVYRNGHELLDNGKRLSGSPKELKTEGEFGPVLITVFNDLAKGTVVLGHWEQSATGVLALFRYSVPQRASHYLVSFSSLTEKTRHYPAYHGEIALDPVTGSIMRISAIAELDPNDAVSSASLSVEYGPTEIAR